MLKGKFIVFEGIDGSGKSTQANLLYRRLIEQNIDTHKTFEPTNRPIGTLLRTYLKGELSCDTKVLAGLFASDRLDHFLNEDDGIIKLVNNGVTVVCDRNYLSNFAYQADEDENFVPSLNQKVRDMLKPDAHIFIDISTEVALDRIKKNRDVIDIFENEKALKEISANYKKYFKILENEEKIIVIDGNRDEKAIADDVFAKISHLFDA